MLLLKRVTVTYNTPSLRGEQRFLKCMIGQIAEVDLLLQMPQACRVVLKSLKSIWFYLNYLFVNFLSILVFSHLKVASSDLCVCPSGRVLLLSKLVEYFESFLAFIKA